MSVDSFFAKSEKTISRRYTSINDNIKPCFFFYFTYDAFFNTLVYIYPTTGKVVAIPLRYHEDFPFLDDDGVGCWSPNNFRKRNFVGSAVFVSCGNDVIHV